MVCVAVQDGKRGFMQVVSSMYKNEGGLKAFVSGSSARVLWLLPFTIIHLGVYEGARYTHSHTDHNSNSVPDMCEVWVVMISPGAMTLCLTHV